MSRYLYDIANPEPRPYEAVEAFVDLLKARVALLILLKGNSVYAHEVPADKPPTDRWLVVRELIEVGGIAETSSGLVVPTIQVMSESRISAHTAEAARLWHAQVQAEAAAELIGATISIATGVAVAIHRSQRPTGVAYDRDDNTRYSTSAFRMTMGAA